MKILRIMPFLLLGMSAAIIAQDENLQDGLYAKMETSKGTILLSLEYEKVPLTVANFVGLAEGTLESSRDGVPYYDGLIFHRVIEDFMIQTGDPTGTGSGGPGYSFPDEIHPDLRHSAPGTLSMANRGPDTNGSQIFITHVATPWLDDRHAVFGRVVDGMNVVNAIAQGDTITKVTILRIGSTAEAFQVTQRTYERLRKQAEESVSMRSEEQREVDLALIEERWADAKKTRSGIHYIIQERGSGRKKPRDNSQVVVHYQGSLLNGAVFDSSMERGEPLEFGLGQVIRGWQEMLKDMKKGEKRTAIIPPELGYGAQGYPGVIPPNSFLVFEIELIDFE